MLSRNNAIGPASYTATSILDAALHYVRSGLHIFPCDPNTKKPLTANGYKDASRDEKQVIAFWTAYPNAMIGMPCGEINGVFVSDLDLDPLNNIDGFATMAAVTAQRGELPKTLTTITPRGGRHLIYKWRPGLTLRNRTSAPGPGCDVRANGGYIILPPSVRADGVAYTWDDNGALDPVDAPEWFIALISPQKASTGRGKKAARKNARLDLTWAITGVENECNAIAATLKGGRNDQLYRSAFSVYQIIWGNPGLLNEEQVREKLLEAADECGLIEEDGLDSCLRTIESGAEDAKALPRVRPAPQPAGPKGLNLHTAGAGIGTASGTASSAGSGPASGMGPSGAGAGTGAGTGATAGASHGAGAQAGMAPDPRYPIQLTKGNLHVATDEVETALMLDRGYGLYQRAGELVRAVHMQTEAASVNNTERSTLVWQIMEAAPFYLLQMFELVAQFFVYDKRSKAWIPHDCPLDLVRRYQARLNWKLPQLFGVVHTPLLRWDGSLHTTPGYDPETQLLFKPDGETFPPIPDQPTRDDALAAMELIKDALKTFPFKTPVDLSVALSLFLTAMCRRLIAHAPLHGISSPAARTGKSLLVDLVSILQCGQPAPVITPGPDVAEMEKRLGALLMTGVNLISFDNCDQPLSSALLCQAVTQRTVSVRVLGASRHMTLPTPALFVATGNNLSIVGDLAQRSLYCRLDAGVERPELRVFTETADEMFRQRRGELVMALLTILRAHRLARPTPKQPPLGGFRLWSLWVRDALTWLDCPDPVETNETVVKDDPEQHDLVAVITAWENNFGLGAEMQVQTVIERANLIVELRQALLLVAEDHGRPGSISNKRLGHWLRKINGRFANERRLMRTRILSGYPLYRLQTH